MTGAVDESRVAATPREVSGGLPSPTMSLVLPLYNEAAGLVAIVAGLTEALERERIPYQLVLVDNGSTDGSAGMLAALAGANPSLHVTTVAVNEGYGWGIICGLKEATGGIVGFMCADGQIEPADLIKVYRRQCEGGCDLAKVVRVSREDGPQRQLMSWVYNTSFRLLFQLNERDINGTPKLLPRERLAQLQLTSKDWFIDAELMISAVRCGFRIGEVPVNFLARGHGASNVRLTTSLQFVWNMLRYRFFPRQKRR